MTLKQLSNRSDLQETRKHPALRAAGRQLHRKGWRDPVHFLHLFLKGARGRAGQAKGPSPIRFPETLTPLSRSAGTRSSGWPWTQAPTTTRSPWDASAAWGKAVAQRGGRGASRNDENILKLHRRDGGLFLRITKNPLRG